MQLPKLYICYAFLRIFLICLPQTGYLHPDEYFQSIEVISETSFNIKVNKPWEFNATLPIRSVAPIYFTVGLSFQILKLVDRIFQQQFNVSLTTPYYLLLFPRLFICCLSFVVDWCLYCICSANSEKCKSRSLILGTSYIMLTYATRTFSNVIELILFSILLYYVAESIIFSNINIRQSEYINKRYSKAETVVEKAKFHKLRLYLENDSLRNYFIIATVTTAGFFNRPTFAAYAIAPVFFWLYRGIGFKSIMSLQFHLRTIAFLISTIPTIIFFIIVDSFYFGYLTWGEISVFMISINNFVVTPWNFIKYNINPCNLAEHGLHPRYLNVLINIPLLFGVLAFLCYANLLDLLVCLMRGKYHYLPSVRSIRGLMTASILFPVTLLSLVPHQEPRFLIPIILPLVYLYGPSIRREQIDIVMKPTEAFKMNMHTKPQRLNILFKTWLGVNAALALFYGFIHQGGVYQFISHISNEMQSIDNNLNYEVVTSHIYTIPHSLFYEETNQQRNPFKRVKRITLHEKGSTDLRKVLQVIETLLQIRARIKSNFIYKLYLVIPETLIDKLMYHLSNDYLNVTPIDMITFYPHLSTEALPDLLNFDYSEPSESVMKVLRSFGLTRVQFQINNTLSI